MTYTSLLLDFVETLFTAQSTEILLDKATEFLTNTFKISNTCIYLKENKKRFYSNIQIEKEYSLIEQKLLELLCSLKTITSIASIKKDVLTENIKIENIPNSVLAIPLIDQREFFGAIFLYSEKELKDFQDISDQLQKRFLNAYKYINKYDELKKTSVTDPLTGLFNRIYMIDFLNQTLKHAEISKKPTSIIILDLDNFKGYNDTKGHLEGDKLLKTVSEGICNKFRFQDVACRYGGEEFVVILPNTESKIALQRAEEVRRFIEADCNTTISVGVMTCLNSSLSSQEMLKNADDALYKAKRTGKNKVIQYISVDKSLGVIDTTHAI
ncbi:GGDEF domain-containing protein [Candidatus Woesearchaeota archaeon]|nr:GGDEF domain-containing protein [Candidatus Woesearchaeota archaeon]